MGLSEEEQRKQRKYNKELYFLDQTKCLLLTFVMLAALTTESFSYLETAIEHLVPSHSWWLQAACFFVFYCLIYWVLGFPLKYYRAIVVDPKHEILVRDRASFIKGWVLSAVFSTLFSVMALVILAFILQYFTTLWPFVFVLFLAIFLLIANYIIPLFIEPAFTKYSHLKNYAPDLYKEVAGMLSKMGVHYSKLLVHENANGSRRMGAYMSGFFNVNKIVLSDHLIKGLNTNEVLCVVGHEISHLKNGDHWRHLVIEVMTIALFIIPMVFLAQQPLLINALGFKTESSYVIILITIITSRLIFEDFMNLFRNFFKRKREHRADAFSAEYNGSSSMKSALIKTYKNNSSLAMVHPWYSLYCYDHPTLPERLKHLDIKGSRGALS